jgi:hypothetical protein
VTVAKEERKTVTCKFLSWKTVSGDSTVHMMVLYHDKIGLHTDYVRSFDFRKHRLQNYMPGNYISLLHNFSKISRVKPILLPLYSPRANLMPHNLLPQHISGVLLPQQLILLISIVNPMFVREVLARDTEVVRRELPDLVCGDAGFLDGLLPGILGGCVVAGERGAVFFEDDGLAGGGADGVVLGDPLGVLEIRIHDKRG